MQTPTLWMGWHVAGPVVSPPFSELVVVSLTYYQYLLLNTPLLRTTFRLGKRANVNKSLFPAVWELLALLFVFRAEKWYVCSQVNMLNLLSCHQLAYHSPPSLG